MQAKERFTVVFIGSDDSSSALSNVPSDVHLEGSIMNWKKPEGMLTLWEQEDFDHYRINHYRITARSVWFIEEREDHLASM